MLGINFCWGGDSSTKCSHFVYYILIAYRTYIDILAEMYVGCRVLGVRGGDSNCSQTPSLLILNYQPEVMQTKIPVPPPRTLEEIIVAVNVFSLHRGWRLDDSSAKPAENE